MRWKRVETTAAWVSEFGESPITDATALVVFDEGTNTWRDPTGDDFRALGWLPMGGGFWRPPKDWPDAASGEVLR